MRMMWLAAMLIFVSIAFAHGVNEEAQEQSGPSLIDISVYAFGAVILISVISALFQDKIGEIGKKAAFGVIAVIVIAVTLYLSGTIVWTNTHSVSGGPIHWHADYEVWACGDKLELEESKGLSNRIGTPLFHNHNDYRIHVEGVVRKWEDVHLGGFFEVIGGEFTTDTLTVILKDGTKKTWRNGDLCPDGHEGMVRLYVNGKLNDKMDEYVISPYADVPPGDVLKIAFE